MPFRCQLLEQEVQFYLYFSKERLGDRHGVRFMKGNESKFSITVAGNCVSSIYGVSPRYCPGFHN